MVEKWEIPNVVNKNIPKNRQLRVDRCDLAEFRSEWGAESLKRGRGIELEDFTTDFTSDELTLEVCAKYLHVSNCEI